MEKFTKITSLLIVLSLSLALFLFGCSNENNDYPENDTQNDPNATPQDPPISYSEQIQWLVSGVFSFNFSDDEGNRGRVEVYIQPEGTPAQKFQQIRVYTLEGDGQYTLRVGPNEDIEVGPLGLNGHPVSALANVFIPHFANLDLADEIEYNAIPIIDDEHERAMNFIFTDGKMSSIQLDDAVINIYNLANSPTTLPGRKGQLDWLIAAAGGNDHDHESFTNPIPQFSYNFTSEDGEITGIVRGNNGNIVIYAPDQAGVYQPVSYPHPAFVLAYTFTQHFETMTRYGHSHQQHPLNLSGRTEYYPIDVDSEVFIHFTYDRMGMLNAMDYDDGEVVKLVSNLQNSAADTND